MSTKTHIFEFFAEILMEIHEIKIRPDDDDKHVGSFKCGRAI